MQVRLKSLMCLSVIGFLATGCKPQQGNEDSASVKAIETEIKTDDTKVMKATDDDDIMIQSQCLTEYNKTFLAQDMAPENTRIVMFKVETLERELWFDKSEKLVLLVPNVAVNCEMIKDLYNRKAKFTSLVINLAWQDFLANSGAPSTKSAFYIKSFGYVSTKGKEEVFEIKTTPLAPEARTGTF